MSNYADPDDPLNGPKYHTGKPCIEVDCENPAGTAWSPLWCQPCNAVRMRRLSRGMDEIAKRFGMDEEGTAP
jgi:hypothetical protein